MGLIVSISLLYSCTWYTSTEMEGQDRNMPVSPLLLFLNDGLYIARAS